MPLDRPPGGWSELVTKEHLRLELDALESRIGTRFAQVDSRFAQLESRMDARFAQVDSQLALLVANVDTRIQKAFATQLRWLVGTIIAFAAVLVANQRL